MTLPDRTYRTAEFAALAGVTVRALHHYDRLGLLRPRRTDAGYRVYTTRDLEVLEQIVALKFIGVPLKEIAVVRRATSGVLTDVLAAQRRTLDEKRRQLVQAIDAIGKVEDALRAGHAPDPSLFRTIIEVIEMQQNEQEWMNQYRQLLDAKIATLKAMSPETRAALRQQWADLVEEIKPCVDDDPAEPRAQAFVDRWLNLLQQVSGAIDPAWASFLGAADQRANVERFREQGGWPDKAGVNAMLESLGGSRVWGFMQRAIAARATPA